MPALREFWKSSTQSPPRSQHNFRSNLALRLSHCLPLQVFVGPQVFRLKVPCPESAAALTQRSQSVPASPMMTQANLDLPRRTSFAGSLRIPDVKSSVLWHRTLKGSDDGSTENQSAGSCGEVASQKHYPQRGQAVRPPLSGRSRGRKGQCAHSNNRRLGRPWQQLYASEQQLKRLCKQRMGSRALPHATSEWNLFLSVLEWEVDRESAMNSTDRSAAVSAAVGEA